MQRIALLQRITRPLMRAPTVFRGLATNINIPQEKNQQQQQSGKQQKQQQNGAPAATAATKNDAFERQRASIEWARQKNDTATNSTTTTTNASSLNPYSPTFRADLEALQRADAANAAAAAAAVGTRTSTLGPARRELGRALGSDVRETVTDAEQWELLRLMDGSHHAHVAGASSMPHLPQRQRWEQFQFDSDTEIVEQMHHHAHAQPPLPPIPPPFRTTTTTTTTTAMSSNNSERWHEPQSEGNIGVHTGNPSVPGGPAEPCFRAVDEALLSDMGVTAPDATGSYALHAAAAGNPTTPAYNPSMQMRRPTSSIDRQVLDDDGWSFPSSAGDSSDVSDVGDKDTGFAGDLESSGLSSRSWRADVLRDGEVKAIEQVISSGSSNNNMTSLSSIRMEVAVSSNVEPTAVLSMTPLASRVSIDANQFSAIKKGWTASPTRTFNSNIDANQFTGGTTTNDNKRVNATSSTSGDESGKGRQGKGIVGTIVQSFATFTSSTKN